MRPRPQVRTGKRRDNGVLRIHSNGPQTYPGVELPADEVDASALTAEELDGRTLAPALDTGIEVQTRLGRLQEGTARRNRRITVATVAALLVLVTAVIGWRYVSDRMAAVTPLVVESEAATPTVAANAASAAPTDTAAAALASATPIFAYYGKVKLHLPVQMKRLTEIGFHQAAYPWAMHIKTQMKDANLNVVARTRSTGRIRADEPSGPNAIMTGLVLRMWRSGRAGRPDTAADVGAGAGAPVLSPVTGTIVRIRPYMLYGRYPDYELHIIPDGTSGIDIVLIHLTDLTCTVGEHVVGGVTPIAHVRKLSDKFYDQLASYTKSPGDHVHIQVNNSNYPGYKGLDGAADPSDYDNSSIID